ncbi:MAG: hypothetical protein ACLQPN_20725 [Bryobacteraceae bacterium]
MADGQVTVDAAVADADSLQRILKRQKAKQVQSDDERQIIKGIALAWFKKHRPILVALLGEDQVEEIDEIYRELIEASGRATTRTRYLEALKAVKKRLGTLQAEHVITLATPPTVAQQPAKTPDGPPQFAPLISDPRMQAILAQRWRECVICVTSGAPLAATVMMGGILEGLLLAKINQLPNMAPVFTATSAPRDKAGKTLVLKEWTLKNYIDVAHELKWITTAARDIGEVMRDYRNYIHPQKELSHGISLVQGDAQMLWEIAKSVILQIL